MLFDRPELSPAMQQYLGSDRVSRYPADTEDDSDPVVRRVARPEDPGMYGVQTWSAGPIYPAIIRVVETYRVWHPSTWWDVPEAEFYAKPLSERLFSREYILAIPGFPGQWSFDTRGEAEEWAISMQGKVPA